MTRNRLNEMLERAKWNTIAMSELRSVASALDRGEIDPDLRYTALHLLGRSARPEFESTLANFIESPSDPMLSRLAIQALCLWLGLGGKYRAQLLRFIDWVEWDEADDVRQIAIAAAGRLARESPDSELVAALLCVADDPAEMPLTRDEAVRSLAIALGDAISSLPSPATMGDADSTWAVSVRDRSRLLLLGGLAE